MRFLRATRQVVVSFAGKKHWLCEESLLQSGARVGSKPNSHVCLSDAMIGSFVITAVQKWIAGDKHDKWLT